MDRSIPNRGHQYYRKMPLPCGDSYSYHQVRLSLHLRRYLAGITHPPHHSTWVWGALVSCRTRWAERGRSLWFRSRRGLCILACGNHDWRERERDQLYTRHCLDPLSCTWGGHKWHLRWVYRRRGQGAGGWDSVCWGAGQFDPLPCGSWIGSACQ